MPIEEMLRRGKFSSLLSSTPLLSTRAVYSLTICLAVYVIVRNVVAAAQKPFWFDEILTL
jgi:hypothetical protein